MKISGFFISGPDRSILGRTAIFAEKLDQLRCFYKIIKSIWAIHCSSTISLNCLLKIQKMYNLVLSSIFHAFEKRVSFAV